MYKLDWENAEESEITVNIRLIIKKGNFKKNICFIDYTKAFDCVDHNKLWKILKEIGIPTTLLAACKTCMQVKKQQLESDMEQKTNSKLEKSMSRLYIVILHI